MLEVVGPCAALNDWFVDNILVHDAALTRFLRCAWSNAAEVPDFRQEAYVRVYEAATKERPKAPKALLFTTARHLLIDRARRQRVVAIGTVADCDALNILVDEISAEERVNAHQELRQLAEAFDLLPSPCRDAVWLRKVENLSQKEIASRLSISEKTVENHIARGMQRLAEHLHVSGSPRRSASGRQRHGFLVFHDTTLAAAASEFNRYNTRKLLIRDPSTAAIRIGGHFRATNLEVFVRLLEDGFPIQARHADDAIVLTAR